MRLLIYLLAMMTGFSAAEAARPISATPAAVAQGVVIVASVASAEREVATESAEYIPSLKSVAAVPAVSAFFAAASTPVLRHDITRQ